MRFGRFNTAAHIMISDLFEADELANIEESSKTQISVKVGIPTASMLTVLSDLFKQSRFAFSGEILEDFAADLFANLPPEKREEVAAKADKISTEMLAKQGISVVSSGPAGNEINEDQTWRGLAPALRDMEP